MSEKWRKDFPILGREVHGRRLVYLDNAASTHKPAVVVEALERFYSSEYSNVHRGLHRLSTEATRAFEEARRKVQRFIGAATPDEIVFTSGTTAAINLVARTYGDSFIGEGDEILITEMEHHANIVPWQMLARRTGARLVVAPIDDRGELIVEEFENRLGPDTKIAALTHTSNVLGTRNPLRDLIDAAQRRGVPVLVDGAQAVGHERVDVSALGCDFFAFSGHKMFGPTGVGILYGRSNLLEKMPPFLGGGEMIRSVSFEETTYREPPARFEAGTPPIAGAIGLGAAIDYLEAIGLDSIEAHDSETARYALEKLKAIPGLRFVGTAKNRAAIISFVLDGIHPHDAATVLDMEGVAVRAGHHCAQPLMSRFGIPATLRASFALYNQRREVDALVEGLGRVLEVLG